MSINSANLSGWIFTAAANNFVSPNGKVYFYPAPNQESWLITKQINIPAGGDEYLLKFWTKLNNPASPGTFKVMISTTANGNTEEYEEALDIIPTITATYQEYTVSLSAYSGKSIYVGFYAKAAASQPSNLYLDDIKVGKNIDLTVAEITAPASGVLSNAEAVKVKISNVGSVNVTGLTLQLYLDNVKVSEDLVLSETINAGQDLTYTFSGDYLLDLSGKKGYDIKVTVTGVTGEIDTNNNSLTTKVYSVLDLAQTIITVADATYNGSPYIPTTVTAGDITLTATDVDLAVISDGTVEGTSNGTDAGVVTLSVTAKGASNLCINATTATYSILPKELTIEGFEVEKSWNDDVDYDLADGLGTLTFVGLQNGETADVDASGIISVEFANSEFGEQTLIFEGEFAFVEGTAKATNYTVKQPTDAKGTITAGVLSVAINEPDDIEVLVGGTQQFNAIVEQRGYEGKVTWTIVETVETGTAIDEDGLLTVAVDEPEGTIHIVATSVDDPTKSNTISVVITNTSIPKVFSILISADKSAVAKGSTANFGVVVSKQGSDDGLEDVEWILTGNESDDTTIDADGLLTVADDETEGVTLTVSAKSTYTGYETVVSNEVNLTVIYATVTSVVVNANAEAGNVVYKGKDYDFTATVLPAGAQQDVTWSVSPITIKSEIDENGKLTVAADENATTFNVIATAKGDVTKSNFATVTVKDEPTITNVAITSPEDGAIVFRGLKQQFTAEVTKTGDAPTTVTWSVNSTKSAINATTGELTVAEDEDAETLTVTATSTFNTSKTDAVSVTVKDVPVITVTVSPDATGVEQGKTITFNVDVDVVQGEVDDYTVTWSVNSTKSVIDATTGELTVGADETVGTTLTVTATSNFDGTTGTATVTVKIASAVTEIAIKPATASVQRGGEKRQFSAEVTGDGDAYTQEVIWSVEGNVSDDTEISEDGLLTVDADEEAETLIVKATSVFTPGVFGTATVTLFDESVIDAATPVVSQLEDKTVIEDEALTLTVTATVDDGGDITYQWYSNNARNTTGAEAIADATTASYVVPTATVGTKYYYVVVTNTNNDATGEKIGVARSNIILVTVNEAPAIEIVTVSPATDDVKIGTTKQFSATVVAKGGAAQTVTWSVDGNESDDTEISEGGLLTVSADETAETLTVTATSTVDTNKKGTATVTVIPVINAAAPVISAQPQSKNAEVGDADVVLSVTANVETGGAISYQWFKAINSTSNTGGAEIVGATNATYSVTTAEVGTTYYYVAVTNTNNSVNGAKTATVNSNVATVAITVPGIAQTPVIATQPADVYVNVNETATLTVVVNSVTDGGTLSYQWYSNGETSSNEGGTLITGATNASYSAPTSALGTMYYYVVVTNTKTGATPSSVTSNPAKVVVSVPQVITSVTIEPEITSIIEGETQQFTGVANGTAANTVQWSLTGNIPATTISTSGLLSVAAGETGEITVTATSTFDPTKSASVTLTVVKSVVTSITIEGIDGSFVQKGTTSEPFTATVYRIGTVATTDVNWTVESEFAGTIITKGADNTATLSIDADETANELIVTATSVYTPSVTTTAKVTVSEVAVVNAAAPSIAKQPEGKSVTENATEVVTLSIEASSTDGGAITYQWYKNSVQEIAGATAIDGANNCILCSVNRNCWYCVLLCSGNEHQ